MHAHTVNYRKRDGASRGQLVNLGFFVHGVPRLMLWCRLFGHRPVVDGTGEYKRDHPDGERYGDPNRWVVCDRCGVRGDPQGSLPPQDWHIGDRYTGPFQHAAFRPKKGLPAPARIALRDGRRWFAPGPIPYRGEPASGQLGGQLVIGGGGWAGFGWELKVGNCSSEHVLACNVGLGPVGALYLHTGHHGQWVQRRLNPVGYESRIIRQKLRDGVLEWRLWSRRDSGTRLGPGREPWWRNGELSFRLRDKMFGRRLYSYTDVGPVVSRIVRMPEGAEFLVLLQLQQQTLGRKRLARWARRSWNVDWSAAGRGIPTKARDRGRILGSGVAVSDAAVRAGTWPSEAVCAITTQMVRDRTRNEWEPLGKVPVDPAAVPA